jgi:Ca-activated chloride channel family protein
MLQRPFFKYGLIITLVLIVLAAFYACNFGDVKARLNVKILLVQGDMAYHDNEWGDAEVCYRKALLLAPALYMAQYNLANCYYRQQRYTEATGAYVQALTGGDSTYKADVYNNLGNTAYVTNNLQQSADNYRTALLFNPTCLKTRQNYLLVLIALKAVVEKQSSSKSDDHKKSGPDNKDDRQKDAKDQPSKKKDDKSDEESKASKINISNLFKLINQSEGNLKNKIGSGKRKNTTPPSTGPDY